MMSESDYLYPWHMTAQNAHEARQSARQAEALRALIEASPALLAACHAALDWRGLDGDGISDPVREQLHAAIAHAEGKS